MVDYRRLEASKVGNVSVVRFVDRKILDAANIEDLGVELFALVEEEQRKNLVLNFAEVEFLSSAALNKLIILDKKVKAAGGQISLCELRPEIYEVFVITKLTQLFDIKETEVDSIKAFE